MPELDPAGYAELLTQAKARIQTARTRAALAVNADLIGPTGGSAGSSSTASAKHRGAPA
jgi:hypothetical protein